MQIEDIPEAEREYIIPGQKNVFKYRGKYWIYLGKWAGWREHDRIYITPKGIVVGVIGEVNADAARAAAERIIAAGVGVHFKQ